MGTSTIHLHALRENLPVVMSFLSDRLDEADCPFRARMQIELAVEEIFVNIASYAYVPGTGDVDICMETIDDPAEVIISFTDQGREFDPMKKEDPDVSLSAAKRQIGGLGIFTVRKFMDDVQYERKGNNNVLTIRKSLA